MRGQRDDAVDVLLVADDDETTRRIAAEFDAVAVETSVRVVTDGTEALRILTDSPADPDLVFLDRSLSRTDGLDLLEALADEAVLGRRPVLVLARPGNSAAIRERYRLGANASLEKPRDAMGTPSWSRRSRTSGSDAALPAGDG
ncbi:response regulator [Natrinema saccharevitans]|uniref:response regulator n=1 Tax=Natrinema saccharevitans TaxID=301967 RepID=UPI002679AE37